MDVLTAKQIEREFAEFASEKFQNYAKAELVVHHEIDRAHYEPSYLDRNAVYIRHRTKKTVEVTITVELDE